MTEPMIEVEPKAAAESPTAGPTDARHRSGVPEQPGAIRTVPPSFSQFPLRPLSSREDGRTGSNDHSLRSPLRRRPVDQVPDGRRPDSTVGSATLAALRRDTVLRRDTALRRDTTTAPATPEQLAIRAAIELAVPQLPLKVRRFLASLPPEAEQEVMALGLVTVKTVLIGLAFLSPEQQDALPGMDAAELRTLMTKLAGATFHRMPDEDNGAPGPEEHSHSGGPSGEGVPEPRSGGRGPVQRPLALGAPLVTVHDNGDAGRDYTVIPTDALIRAFQEDYTTSKTYLQEGEGNRLADHLGVKAEVFDQPKLGEPVVRLNCTYGSGAQTGILFYVNKNHYQILRELGAHDLEPADLSTADGRRFKRGTATVSDGNCLIDGLLMLAGKPHTDTDFQEMRVFIKSGATTSNTAQILEGVLTSMLAGEWPQGLGAQTWKVLNSETTFMQLAHAERTKKQEAESKKDKESSKINPVPDLPKDDVELQKGLLASFGEGKGGPPQDSTPGSDDPGKKVPGKKVPAKKVQAPRTPSTEEELADLRGHRAKSPAEGLEDKVAATREKLQRNGSSTGLPHVFNKIFAQLEFGMKSVLDKAGPLAGDLSKAATVYQQVVQLHTTFEEDYRKHLIADLPPSAGPDENSLAFGSESSGLFFLMDGCFDLVMNLATAGGSPQEEITRLQNEFRASAKSVKAQLLELVRIGIDTAAEAHLAKVSNSKDRARNVKLIGDAKQFLQQNSALATGVLIPDFYQSIGDAIRLKNSAGPKKKVADSRDEAPKETSKTSVARDSSLSGAAKFAESVDTKLKELAAREAERQKTDKGKNPEARAAEILTEIKNRWSDPAAVGRLYDDDQKWFGQSAREDARVVKRVYAHAVAGRKSEVLPAEASPTDEPKADGKEFATATHDVVGGKGKASFASTGARNVVYANKDLAMAAARKMLGLDEAAEPHARYVLGAKDLPKVQPSDIRIEMERDQSDSNPGEGYVEEYITDTGPMVIAYHTHDCNAKIKVDGKEQAFAPHFHVGTIPGESIDKDYWKGVEAKDRTPQFGSGITTTYDFDGEARKAKDAKDYVQHDHDHHLYHL